MDFKPRDNLFRQEKPRLNIYRILMWLGLIAAGVWLLLQIGSGDVEPLFQATPTATRTVNSYLEEARALFAAGKLIGEDNAIDAYRDALSIAPENADLRAEMARVQTYASSILPPDQQIAYILEAEDIIRTAVEIEPENSNALAVLALVLDWKASLVDFEERQRLLAEADSAVSQALVFDNQNPLALAFFAEVLIDQFQYDKARRSAEDAVALAPDLMDTHRVLAYVLESSGLYVSAIEEYKRAVEITPNFTYLYIKIGQNYRQLGNQFQEAQMLTDANRMYETALYYFDQAATINATLEIPDPLPYRAIANTYSQMGEFFIAARNIERAIEFDPTNTVLYADLGMIYFKSRNYEGAIRFLGCAVDGCPVDEVQSLLAELGIAATLTAPISALPLNYTNAFYYVTYGSVLAALHDPPDQNYCPRALTVLAEVRGAFPDDSVLVPIVQESENICTILMGQEAVVTPAATPTTTPEP